MVADRRGEAIAVLREVVGQPLLFRTANSFRFDRIWSGLKDDPRFEEILKPARPL